MMNKKQVRHIKKILKLAYDNNIKDMYCIREKKYCNKFVGRTELDAFITCDQILKVYVGSKLVDKSDHEKKLIKAVFQDLFNKNYNIFKNINLANRGGIKCTKK